MDVQLLENFTSSSSSDLKDQDGLAQRIFETGLIVDKYYTPLLCLLGALGNGLSLAVFCMDRKYRRQSSSYYLCALAISDSGFLLNLFAVWLEMMWGGVITAHALACPLVMYLGQVTCFVSVYLTVAFTLERYIAINFPFSRPRLCTKSKAKKVIAAVVTVALLLFSYAWIIAEVVELPAALSSFGKYKKMSEHMNSSADHTLEWTIHNSPLNNLDEGSWAHVEVNNTANQYNWLESDNVSRALMCTVPERYFEISEIANYVDSAVTLIIPFLLITFFNLRIGTSVWRLRRERKHIMASFASTTLHATMIVTASGDSRESKGNCPYRQNNSDVIRSQATKRLENHNNCPVSERGKEALKPISSIPVESNSNIGPQTSQRNLNSYPLTSQLPPQQPLSSEVRVTKTLLLVSTVFLVLNLPLHAIRCTQFILQTASGAPNGFEILMAFQPWANMLFNTNFAVNFLLYCVAGENFRTSLRNIAKRMILRHQQKSGLAVNLERQYSLRDRVLFFVNF